MSHALFGGALRYRGRKRGVIPRGSAHVGVLPSPRHQRLGSGAATLQHCGQRHFSTADSGSAVATSAAFCGAGGTAFHLPPSPKALVAISASSFPATALLGGVSGTVRRCAGEGSRMMQDGGRSSREQGNCSRCKKPMMKKSSAQPVLLWCLHMPGNGHPAGLALQRAHTQGSGGIKGFAIPHKREAAVSLCPCSFSFPLLQ